MIINVFCVYDCHFAIRSGSVATFTRVLILNLQLLSLFVTTIFSKAQGFSGLFLATLYGGALRFVTICHRFL